MTNFHGQLQITAADAGAVALPAEINHVVGSTLTALTLPAAFRLMGLSVEKGFFRVKTGNHVSVKATGTFTLTGNPANNDTVTLGAQTYTFKTTLTGGADEIKIGAAATNTLDNMVAAIVAGAGAGTLYGTGTTANASAVAVAAAGDTLLATAITAGTAGNSIASTESGAASSWSAATLLGGLAAGVSGSAPGSTLADGTGSLKLIEGQVMIIPAPDVISVIGDAGTAILTYWYV